MFLNRTLLVLLLSLLLWTSGSLSLQAQTEASPRLIVHLLDYLAKDYAGAVSEDGKILSDFEYAEQVEFATTVKNSAQALPDLAAQPSVAEGVVQLHKLIEGKGSPAQVVPLARQLQQDVIKVSGLVIAPTRWPDQASAAQIYQAQCALCHGAAGAGDGIGGKGLEPAPANFLDQEAMVGAAPLGAFNTIRIGVPGTGMASYSHLSDDETWALAFYVLGLRHQKPEAAPADLVFDQALLAKAAQMNDEQLSADLKVAVDERGGKLSAIRLHEEKLEGASALAIARDHLKEARTNFEAGQLGVAKDFSLRAYLEGIEPIEPRLRAEAPELLPQIEARMGDVRSVIEKQGTLQTLDEKIAAAEETIGKIETAINSSQLDARVAFVAAVGIILREGFEAALIILSLLSVLRAIGAQRAAKWVHFGWISAVVLGIVLWFTAGALFEISGAAREQMEGWASLFAVVVLLGVGFWMHSHSEIDKWKAYIKDKVQAAVDNKNIVALTSIAFIGVFREALETVLFLKVLWIDADGVARTSLMSGVGITFMAVIALSALAIKTSAKLPVTQLFKISSYIMVGLAFILTGKGIHALQESGTISVTNLFSPEYQIDLLGLYPSVQVIGAQIVTLVVIGILMYYSKKPLATAK